MSAARSHKPGRGLIANSIALLATNHMTIVLGYLFWTVCARGVSASTIGMMNTVISAITLVAVLTATGFEPFLMRMLPGANSEERSGLCGTALVVSVVVSGAVGVVGALLLPERVQTAVGTGWLVGLLGVGAMSSAFLMVINAALLGVRRADYSLLASILGTLARLIIVAALLGFGMVAAHSDTTAAHTILTVYVASLIISVALGRRLLIRATPGFRFRCGWMWLSRLRQGVPWDHLAMVAGRLPVLLLPILASALFPPAQVGYATIAMLISGAFSAVSALVSNALLAHCADHPENLRTETVRALRLIGAILIVPVVITCLLAPKVLGVFGADYAHYSTLLILLLVATFPNTLTDLALASLRVRRRLVAVAAITVTGSVMTTGGAYLLWLLMPQWGITGAGVSALTSGVIVATAVAVMMLYQNRFSARIAGVAGDAPPCAVDEPAHLIAPTADVALLSPVVAFAAPADDSPSEIGDRSGIG
ncbi:lipopolysaccharide biosynthesis protein [Mycobacterium sp. NPDC048908]|uniref:lipopolysaccharide biosynthesis protein n=1 Tax=Mycobacterium sp. NPDC048908 TaxID=3364292 RepID=UPI003715CFA4